MEVHTLVSWRHKISSKGIPRPFKQYYYNGGINVIIINNNYSSYYLIHVLVYPEEHGKYSSDNTNWAILLGKCTFLKHMSEISV